MRKARKVKAKRRFVTIADAEDHYRKVLAKIGVTTSDRTTYEIVREELGVRSGDDMNRVAKEFGVL